MLPLSLKTFPFSLGYRFFIAQRVNVYRSAQIARLLSYRKVALFVLLGKGAFVQPLTETWRGIAAQRLALMRESFSCSS